jgi:membrane-associated phospholipid phosphatase
MKIFAQFFKSILLTTGCFCFLIHSHAQNWEINLLENINPSQPNSIFWKGASSSVYPVAIASPLSMLTIGYLQKDKVMQAKGWKNIGSLMINTAITQGLKYSINRERPYQKYPLQIHPYQIENDASFPSGHTSTAFTTAASLSIHFKKWYVIVPAYAWATSVGYSRMYLGEHYPTDVLVGAAIGTGSAYLSQWLYKKMFETKKKKDVSIR